MASLASSMRDVGCFARPFLGARELFQCHIAYGQGAIANDEFTRESYMGLGGPYAGFVREGLELSSVCRRYHYFSGVSVCAAKPISLATATQCPHSLPFQHLPAQFKCYLYKYLTYNLLSRYSSVSLPIESLVHTPFLS
jgi:hypothetical protein